MVKNIKSDRIKQRLDWVDYARGIGIILVVFAHNLGGQRNAGLPLSIPLGWVIQYAYSFHMPLFFLLSGLFAVQSYRKGLIPFLESKLRTIFYPFVVWSLIEGIIVSSMGGYVTHALSLKHQVASFLIHPIEQMWFLQTLFIIFVLFALAQRVGVSPLLFFLVSVGSILLITPWVRNEMFERVTLNAVFFAVGAWLHSSINMRLQNEKMTALLGFFLVALSVQLYLVFGHFPMIPALKALQYLSVLIIGLIGIASISSFSEVLSRKGWVRFLRVIGEYSLPIYLMHTIFGSGTRIILMHILHMYDPTVHAVLELAVGVGFPMLIAYGLKKRNAMWAFEWPAAYRVKPAT